MPMRSKDSSGMGGERRDKDRPRKDREDRHQSSKSRDRDRERDRDRDRKRDDKRSSRNAPGRDRDRKRDRKERDRDRDRDRDRKDRDRDRDRKDRDRDGKKSKSSKSSSKSKGSDKDRSKKSQNSNREKPKLAIEGLDKLAKKVNEEKDRNEKPVFLTKKQRKELQAKQEKEKKLQLEKKQKEDQKARDEFNTQAKKAALLSREHRSHSSSYSSSRRGRDRDRDRDHHRDRGREEERQQRMKERKQKRKEELVKKEELEIKQQYLGGGKSKKKKVVPPSKKFRFSFDWELTDDTSEDLNPLYGDKANISLMFGRGSFGGMDDQKGHSHDILAETKHWKDKKLWEMNDRDWRIFKEDYNISTRGSVVPNPIRFWSESDLPKQILEALREVGYEEPTPIQRMGIPIGLRNRDVVGIAETGSGKTCAFLLPMLVYISKLPPMDASNEAFGPYALILAPTRELAQQIERECKKFASRMGIRSAAIVGGVSIHTQASVVCKGAEILIATPGRLNDCLERRYVVLGQCNYVVLDEADRMIDMGFQDQVESILGAMSSSNLRPDSPDENKKQIYRQTIMFSATMSPKIELLSKKYLRNNPAYIAIGERGGKTADNVRQFVHFVSEAQKRKILVELLRSERPPIMVFCNSKKSCDGIANFLYDQDFNCAVLHSGKIQEVREETLAGFKDGTIDILVCTNVACRGIDVEGVTHVINFDMPLNIEDYTHRCGRTGRAGLEGKATSFLTKTDENIMYDLKQLLMASGSEVPHELRHHPASQQKPDGFGRAKKRQRGPETWME